MQDFLNYNISQTVWDIKLNFCIWSDIHRSNNFTHSFALFVFQAWLTCPKLCQVVTQLNLKIEFSYKVSFFACFWGFIEVKIYSAISSGCSQVCPKWYKPTSYLYLKNGMKWNLGMKLLFHLFGSIYLYSFGQSYLDMRKVITNIKSAISQDWIGLRCWFFAYE